METGVPGRRPFVMAVLASFIGGVWDELGKPQCPWAATGGGRSSGQVGIVWWQFVGGPVNGAAW